MVQRGTRDFLGSLVQFCPVNLFECSVLSKSRIMRTSKILAPNGSEVLMIGEPRCVFCVVTLHSFVEFYYYYYSYYCELGVNDAVLH